MVFQLPKSKRKQEEAEEKSQLHKKIVAVSYEIGNARWRVDNADPTHGINPGFFWSKPSDVNLQSSITELTQAAEQGAKAGAKLKEVFEGKFETSLKTSLEILETLRAALNAGKADSGYFDVKRTQAAHARLKAFRSNLTITLFYSKAALPLQELLELPKDDPPLASRFNLIDMAQEAAEIEEEIDAYARSSTFRADAYQWALEKSIEGLLWDTEQKETLKSAFRQDSKALVFCPAAVDSPELKVRALEIKAGSGIYLIPTLALGWAHPWQDAIDSVEASKLTDADIEAIVTLYGGDAYPTLKAARDAALALS